MAAPIQESVPNLLINSPSTTEESTEGESITDIYSGIAAQLLSAIQLTPEEQQCFTNTRSPKELLDTVRNVQRSGCTGSARLQQFITRSTGSILCMLDRYSPAIEVFVSSNPAIAALVWGSVRLVLLVLIASISTLTLL